MRKGTRLSPSLTVFRRRAGGEPGNDATSETTVVSKVPQRRMVSEMKAIGVAERNGAGKYADP